MNISRFRAIARNRFNLYLGLVVKPFFGNRMILLDYPVTSVPRWNYNIPTLSSMKLLTPVDGDILVI
jgi:hypothetical protein